MTLDKSQNSYSNILKGTSIFGGVQILQVLINLLRGKFVAMFLGPDGMGIASLFTTSSNTIQRFSSLGVNLAIVKEISHDCDDESGMPSVMAAVKRLLVFTSLLGAAICVLLCVPISRLTFGTADMSWQFMLLGLAVGFGIAGAGKLSVLQGLHEVKRLSLASVTGGLCGLFVGVPLYYFFKDKGIVPAMVVLSLTMYVFYSVSLRKAVGDRHREESFSWRRHSLIMKRLVQFGLLMMASDLIGSGVGYLLNVFIRYWSDYNTVGLYQAANSITNQYAGMVFAAMAMDYFPRLSRVADCDSAMRTVVNRQMEIVALIIAPAMMLLILTAPVLIRVLLTSEFQSILPLMRWFGLGVLMKALAYPMGYISLAKGNKKLFFWMDGFAGNVLSLALGCVLFHMCGIMGLGYALVLDNTICLIAYFVVNRRLYEFGFTGAALRQMAVAVGLVGVCFMSSYIASDVVSWSAMGASLVMSMSYSIVQIKKVM